MAILLENQDLDIVNMKPKRFIVTCHGWSASNWTAHALSLGKDVLCTHSARNELANDIDLHKDSNLRENIHKFHKGYKKRTELSLDNLYEEIENKGKAMHYGSVHVLRMRDLPIIHEKYGDSIRKFKVANIVRHPVSLVWSGFGQLKDLFKYDINELHWTTGKIVNQGLDFVNKIGKKYQVDVGDYEHLAFIGACAIMSSLKADIDAYAPVMEMPNLEFVGTFQMEKLTSDSQYFGNFIENLNMEDVLSEEYVNLVMNTGNINKHKKDNKLMSASDRFNTFTPMQKEVFRYFFRHSDLSKYQSFGYDVSMI